MKKLSTLLFVAAVALVGCGEKDMVQTVDWYKENPPERMAMLEKCKSNPGELATAPNCINATTAANVITVDNRGYKQRVPMNFSEGGK